MNLNTRFLLLGSCVFMLFAAASWLAFNGLVKEINLQWGEQFAERQVLFDKHRTLSPLIREIHLARQMAAEPAIIQMALHEDNGEIKLQALKVMESYRFNFRDHSYFAAFSASGNYYFNDASGKYSDKQYRYTLSPKNKNDYWFYATVKDGKEYQVNIDPDNHLDVVKVWINVLVKNGDKVLGVLGTGIDLTEFLKESVGINQSGVENFFIDQNMAIQLSTDTKLIDYASIAKATGERIKIDALLKNPDDLERLRKTADKIRSNNSVGTLWVNYHGEKHLLCMAYLPEVGWYDVTLIDEKSLMLLHGFSQLPVLFGALFLIALLLLNFFFRRWVLIPVQVLKASTEEIQHGHYSISPPLVGTGEIAALSNSFKRMVEFIRLSNADLERKVEARTQELHHLTEIDPLTGLLNRRGMIDRFDREISRYTRQAGSLGLLLLDLDHFKHVNDTHGHSVGDLALCATANILQSSKRKYDHAGRWGGEEFLLLLPDCTEVDLLSIAERIRLSIQALQIDTGHNTLSFTVSIGAHYSSAPQTMDAMLHQVDRALYAAKDAGRNCVKLAGKQT